MLHDEEHRSAAGLDLVDADTDAIDLRIQERAPMARNITHEDVGGTALYLASELSSGVTGAVIPVDVGYSIMGL